MQMKDRIEIFIELASRFKDQTEDLHKAYAMLLDVVEREHQAIKTSKISEVEQAGVEKEQVTEFVTRLIEDLQMTSQKIYGAYTELTGKTVDATPQLSDTIEILEEVKAAVDQQSLSYKVYLHVFDRAKVAVAELLSKHRTLKPKVEMNRYLTETMLHQHQQNFLFWQEVVAESEATYTKKGTRRNDQAAGMLKVQV